MTRSVELHDLMWAQVSAAAKKEPSQNTSLMVQSINSVIDIHENRITSALRNRIPFKIWATLIAISGLTMLTLGTQAGLTQARRFIAVVPLTLAFGALLTVVIDLDRPISGKLRVSQQAIIELQEKMK